MLEENEDQTLKNLKAFRALTDEAIENNLGQFFGSTGASIIYEDAIAYCNKSIEVDLNFTSAFGWKVRLLGLLNKLEEASRKY